MIMDCVLILSPFKSTGMLHPDAIIHMTLRYSELRDKMIVVVLTEEVEYECLSVTTNCVGNICMHGLLCKK